MARRPAGALWSSFVKIGLWRSRSLRILLTAAISVLTPLLSAQPSINRFDRQIQAYVRNRDFSGSVLIAREGRVLFRKSYGMANYEWDIPNSESTKFHIASVSKTFTAAAILRLEQQGKLKLNDPLSRYVPDFLNGDRI